MRRIASILGVIALVVGLLFAVGFLARKELAHTTTGVQSYIPGALELLRSCETSSALEPHVQQSLVVYLTIEMRMRPLVWRQAEFLVARVGAGIGYQPVKTLGVGQIGFGSFAMYRIANTQPSKFPALSEWISDLREDCKNVEILSWIVRQPNKPCPELKSRCVLLAACRLHSGDGDECLSKPRFLKYRMAVAAIYSEIVTAQELGRH